MYSTTVESDQLYTWSDANTEAAHRLTAKTPQRSPTPIPPASSDPARFSYRAVQTMRQAGLQMRRWPRPWTQILSIGQLSGVAAANGLCTAGILRANRGVPVELPPSSRDLRNHLRDQPRTASPSRGALKDCHERSAFCPPHTDRCKVGRRASRQYARSLARRQPRGSCNCGDSR